MTVALARQGWLALHFSQHALGFATPADASRQRYTAHGELRQPDQPAPTQPLPIITSPPASEAARSQPWTFCGADLSNSCFIICVFLKRQVVNRGLPLRWRSNSRGQAERSKIRFLYAARASLQSNLYAASPDTSGTRIDALQGVHHS